MRYVLIALVLAGCAASPDRSEVIKSRYSKTCEGLGFAVGSSEHSKCMLDLYRTAQSD